MMRFNFNASNVIVLTVAALAVSFAPEAQACGKKPWDVLSTSHLLLSPLQQLAQPDFSAPENQESAGQSQIVGMWTVNFYVGGNPQPWDFAIEQFHADGLEMTNDIYPPSVGNVCWGVREPSGRRTVIMKHTGVVFDANGSCFGLFDFSASCQRKVEMSYFAQSRNVRF